MLLALDLAPVRAQTQLWEIVMSLLALSKLITAASGSRKYVVTAVDAAGGLFNRR